MMRDYLSSSLRSRFPAYSVLRNLPIHHVLATVVYALALSACSEGGSSRFTPDSIVADDAFGGKVALSDSYALVGSPGIDGMGAVLVFDRTRINGEPSAMIRDFQGIEGDQFGDALATDGDVVLVGAPYHEVNGILAGGAFVFRFDEEQDLWIQDDALEATPGNDLDYFGAALAIEGNIAVVGAPGDDGNGLNAGAAYVFVRSDLGWSLTDRITAPDGASADHFGSSVAISGSTILIGSPGGFGSAPRTGVAYLFSDADGRFMLEKTLSPEVVDPDQEFGMAVALEANIAIIGAPGLGNHLATGGAAYVFDTTNDDGTALEILTAGPEQASQGFGASIQISGTLAAIGAHRSTSKRMSPGSSYVYSNVGTGWSLQARFSSHDRTRADGFGASLGLREDQLLIGAPGDSQSGPNAGSVYSFSPDAGNWD